MNYISLFNAASSPTGLPLTTNFSVPGDSTQQVLMISGSVWTRTANSVLTIQVLIESTVVETINFCCNPTGTHQAFATVFIPLSLVPDNNYTLTIRELDGSPTVTDQNDWYNAMLLL